MLLSVLDGNGIPQTILASAQEAQTDWSAAIVATGVSQVLMPANLLRSGWLIQNRSSNVMHVNDLGTATTVGGSFSVPSGGIFPPPNFPITTGQVSIVGTIGDVFTAREW